MFYFLFQKNPTFILNFWKTIQFGLVNNFKTLLLREIEFYKRVRCAQIILTINKSLLKRSWREVIHLHHPYLFWVKIYYIWSMISALVSDNTSAQRNFKQLYFFNSNCIVKQTNNRVKRLIVWNWCIWICCMWSSKFESWKGLSFEVATKLDGFFFWELQWFLEINNITWVIWENCLRISHGRIIN